MIRHVPNPWTLNPEPYMCVCSCVLCMRAHVHERAEHNVSKRERVVKVSVL